MTADFIVVGGPGDMSTRGSACISARAGSSWSPLTKFAPEDPAKRPFGATVAIVHDTLAVGEPLGTFSSVLVYPRTAGGGSFWSGDTGTRRVSVPRSQVGG